MYIKRTKYKVMEGEPHLGSIVESEIIEDPSEVIEALIDIMVETQELPTTIVMIDDIDDEDIEVEVKDYLTSQQINTLNEAFIASSDWTEEQLVFLLEGE